MINAFYFIIKALFVLKIKFMVSQPVQQTITIHILPNVSRIKGNETMKFAQVIEYSKKNVFLQKSCKKRGRETSSRSLFAFLKKLDIRQKEVVSN